VAVAARRAEAAAHVAWINARDAARRTRRQLRAALRRRNA
jgi:hypothetical protein